MQTSYLHNDMHVIYRFLNYQLLQLVVNKPISNSEKYSYNHDRMYDIENECHIYS